jgi:Zn finger protein HypA/HybF involved in hydrogenase expression
MSCQAKHTEYQPTEEEFVCPSCGKGPKDEPQGLVVEGNDDDGADTECPLLHPHDYLRCYTCDYDTGGQAFASSVAKKKNLVPCPTCKGKGMVPAKKGKKS